MKSRSTKEFHERKKPEEMSETDKFRAMLVKTKAVAPPIKEDDDTSKYLVTVISVLVLGIVGFAGILWLRPAYDPLLVAGIIFAFLTPTTTSLLSFIKAEEAKKVAVETHLSVNSRLDAFIQQSASSAKAEGVKEGRRLADERTDDLRAQKHVEEIDKGDIVPTDELKKYDKE